MQYLIFAIIFSSGIAIIFKLFTRFGINNIQAITVNYILAVLAGYFACQSEFVFSEIFYKPWFYLAIIVGFSFITTFFIYAISAQKAGVAISAVASRMSVVIPVIIGIAIYGEKISILIVAGIILSLLAFYFIFYKKTGVKVTAKYFILPLLLFFGFGFNDSMLKHSQKLYISVSNEYFQFLTVVFFVAFVLGFTAFVFLTIKNKEKLKFKNLNAGIILGIFNFFSTYFFLKGMDYFDSSVYFPILNTGIVTMGALTGRFFFNEYFSIKNWIGVLLAICAIFLLRLG